jgi:hypothetical protein
VIFAFVRRLFFGRPEVKADPDIQLFRECKYCRHCIRYGAANRLTVHLIRDHNFEDEHAYGAVQWILKHVDELKKSHRKGLSNRS